MTNVEKLHSSDLDAIRKMLIEGTNDSASVDDLVNRMDAASLARAWASWHLGSAVWADDILRVYKSIECTS